MTTAAISTDPPESNLPAWECPAGDRREDSAGPPPRTRLSLTILIAALNNGALAGARLIMPMLALTMGIGTAVVGLMMALFSLVPMIFNVQFGRWTDRIGTRVPMMFSTSLILLACAQFEAMPHLATLLVAAGLIGMGGMFSHAAAARAVGELSCGVNRARNLGYLVLSYSAFQFIGPMIAGLVYEHLSADFAFASLAGMALLAAIVLAGRGHNFTTSPRRVQTAATPARTRDLLALPGLLRWLVTSSIFGGVQTVYPLVVALHAVNVGLSPAQAGTLLGGYAIGSALSRASVGLVLRRLSPRVTVLLALIGAALAYAVVPVLHDFQPLFGASLALGFTIGLGAPITLTLIYDTAPPHRVNEAIGLSMAMTNGLQAFLPLSLGFLAAGTGVGVMVWTLALAMLIAAATVVGGEKR